MTKIYAARWIVPVSSPVIEDGAVAVDARHIIAVGSKEGLKLQYPEAKVDDFGYAAIIPGLVNCHSHLVMASVSPHASYTVSRPLLELVCDYCVSELLAIMIRASESATEERFLKEGSATFAEAVFQRSFSWHHPAVSTIKYLDEIALI